MSFVQLDSSEYSNIKKENKEVLKNCCEEIAYYAEFNEFQFFASY